MLGPALPSKAAHYRDRISKCVYSNYRFHRRQFQCLSVFARGSSQCWSRLLPAGLPSSRSIAWRRGAISNRLCKCQTVWGPFWPGSLNSTQTRLQWESSSTAAFPLPRFYCSSTSAQVFKRRPLANSPPAMCCVAFRVGAVTSLLTGVGSGLGCNPRGLI